MKKEGKRDDTRERFRDRQQNDSKDESSSSESKQETGTQRRERRQIKVSAVSKARSPESSAHSSESEEAKLVNDIGHGRTSSRDAEISESETSEEQFSVKSDAKSATQKRTLDDADKVGRNSPVPAEHERRPSGAPHHGHGERKGSSSADGQRSSVSEGFPGATNKKMMLSMLYGQKSMDDLKISEHSVPGPDSVERLDKSNERNLENDLEDLETLSGKLQETVDKLNQVEEEVDKKNSLPSEDFTNLVNKAKAGLMRQSTIDREEEEKRQEEERKKQEELRRKQEEEEAARRAEEAARLQELEWERMITLKRSLIVKDFDFTDLGDDDDVDVLDPHAPRPGDVTDAPPGPPPIPMFGGMPPPPPPLFGGVPAPPPVPGGMMPPPPQGLKSATDTLNKKKMVRLFWQEVKNSPLINGVNKTIWGSIDHVDIDTKKLEHLFENKINPKLKVSTRSSTNEALRLVYTNP